MTYIATYFDHPQQFQRLNNVKEYNNVLVGYPYGPGTTHVSSVHKLMTQYLFFYWSLKCFYDEKKDSKEYKEFAKAFEDIT